MKGLKEILNKEFKEASEKRHNISISPMNELIYTNKRYFTVCLSVVRDYLWFNDCNNNETLQYYVTNVNNNLLEEPLFIEK